jgi:predicted RNA methylase
MITYDNMEVKMMELIILPEIQHRLMPLQPEELAELERSVLDEGIRDPLVVWRKDGQLVLVDGHHRYELAKKHGLSFQIVEREFSDLNEVLVWIDRNQLGRRNLTDEQRAVVMGRLYKTVKQNPILNLKQFQKDNGDRGENFSPRSGPHATAEAIAVQIGVSYRTVQNAAKFADAVEALQEVSPQAAERVLRGEVRDALTNLHLVPKEALSFVADQIVSGERSIKRAMEKWGALQREKRLKEKMAEALPKQAKPFELYCCDIRDAHKFVAANSIDIIITDPPYGREYLHLYDALAEFAAHTLKESGLCVVMCGVGCLPQAMEALGRYLNYVWALSYETPGRHSKLFPLRIINGWKPILYFVKGKLPDDAPWVFDVIKSPQPEKTDHEWQQNLEAFTELVKRFTHSGMVVCDPFCGTGTTGVAALANGCRFVGLDADSEVLEVARKRLEELVG